MKNNSKKLSEHLIKNPSMIIQLINFIIKEPTENLEDKYKYKYPFLSSWIFPIESKLIGQFFIRK